MTAILLTELQCSLTGHALQADMPDVWRQVWLACASVGCMYGRQSVTECDMHYARASVTK